MVSLWNLYSLLFLSLPSSLLVIVSTGEIVEETQQPEIDTAVRFLTLSSHRSHGSDLAPTNNPIIQTEGDDLGRRWLLLSPEEMDRQGVIGEYSDVEERIETNVKGVITSDESATEDPALEERIQTQMSSSQHAVEQTSRMFPPKTRESRLTFPTPQNKMTESHLPFRSGLPSSHRPQQDSISTGSAELAPDPERPPQAQATDSFGLTTGTPVTSSGTRDGETDVTDHNLHRGTTSTLTGKDTSENDDLRVPKDSGTILMDGPMDTSVTSCKTPNQSWTPTYPEDLAPSESLHPSVALSPALLIPLYSDWNSALATWGFAWEVHIYGLGSIFTAFCLISVVCLLGLPLRCPPGSLYFSMLYFFILAFAGIQAFGLLYDAYSYQDRLPPLVSLLLSELPFPCLISAFCLAFLLLSMRSRMHISLPLALSAPFSALPKPCILLTVSILHFIISLGCVGILQVFHRLPVVILLCPQGVFVFLTVFLSCSYLIFYCLTQVNTKHIYRLNDNGESGEFSEVIQPPVCPFSKVEDWERAAGAGIGTSLCLLGCGAFQLYGILHALGFGGVDGYGFQPWPWWGYQVGCRLCQVGVCLGLSLIATHPLFCHSNSSMKTLSQPRPGSWSRLSCNSPLRGPFPLQSGSHSPILSSHDSWSQCKQEKLVICDVTNRQSEALPLCSMVDSPGNGLDCSKKPIPTKTLLSLPTPPCPPLKTKNAAESQLSSLDSLGLESDSTVDLRPPSPINLSRSIDQALFSESLFSHSIFGLPRVHHASSSISLNSPSQSTSKQGPSCVEDTLYRTSSCGDVDQEPTKSTSRPSQPHSHVTSHNDPPISPEQWECITGSTQGLCSHPKETGKLRSNSWANRGQNFAQSSLPRGIPHLSYHRRYRTLSLASQDSQGSGRLAGTKQLSESKQLEWDLAVQAEFVTVCRQIDALSICSDTIEL